jgi:hypothetical protein
MTEDTAKRIAKALESIADSLSLFADEQLRQIAKAKERELLRAESVIAQLRPTGRRAAE